MKNEIPVEKHEINLLIRNRTGLMTRRGFLGAGVGTVAGLAITGSGIRVAEAATTVKMLGWQGYDEPFYVGDYIKDNDIVADMTYIGSIEDILIKLMAGGLGNYGIVMPNWAYIPSFVESGVLQPVDTGRLSNYQNIIPYFRDHPALIYKGQQWGVPFTWGGLPLMYTPSEVAKPTSWMDCFNPAYKGKVAMHHDPLGIMEIWANVVTGKGVGSSLITHAELKKMIDTLIDMKKNYARAFFMSIGEAIDAFSRGEVVISAIGWEPMKLWCNEKGGTQIDYVYPDEGTLGFFDEACIPVDAPDIDVVYDLLDHLISVPGQVPVGNEIFQGVVVAEAVPKLSDAARDLYPYDDIDSFSRKAIMFPFPPTEPDGVHATYDDWLEEYERLLKA